MILHRRFLSAPVAALALGAIGADDAEAPEVCAGEFALVRVARRAMATHFEIAIPTRSHPDPISAATDALDLIDELEDQMTVYREHSEVSRLNATASEVPVEIEERLFELFSHCAVWTHATEGAFDIATGALIKAWGFYQRDGQVPTSRQRNDAMDCTGFRHVILNPERKTVKFRRPGIELNLGAVGKGYALDRAAARLRERWGVRSALLQGGGSSVYALGHPPGQERGWPVQLRHPFEPENSLGTVWLRNCGLGTSAATFQFFEYNGKKLGHLLDPRTGWPVAGTASASVMAATAAAADALSTAAFVLGSAGAEKLVKLNSELGVVVLDDPPNGQSRQKRHGSRGLLHHNFAPNVFSPPDRASA